jgi:hypothetical protein
VISYEVKTNEDWLDNVKIILRINKNYLNNDYTINRLKNSFILYGTLGKIINNRKKILF